MLEEVHRALPRFEGLVSHCCASMALTLSLSPCPQTQLARTLPLVIPPRSERIGALGGTRHKADSWNCPHTAYSQNECQTCRSHLFESFCSRLRIHATLSLVWGLKLEHSRYDRRQCDALTYDEIRDLDSELELDIRLMRSYILYFSPSNSNSPVSRRERGKKRFKLDDVGDPSPPPSPSPLALSVKVGNGIRQATSSAPASDKSKSRVAQWFICQMCSTVLESLMESIYLYIWRHELDWSTLNASTADLLLLEALQKSDEQEIRWRKIMALLLLFERGRSGSRINGYGKSFKKDNEQVIDGESVILSWTTKQAFLAKLPPPNPMDLKSAVIRYEESLETFPAHWPDLNDVENALCHLADFESKRFLDNFSEVLYLYERIFLELERLLACDGVVAKLEVRQFERCL